MDMGPMDVAVSPPVGEALVPATDAEVAPLPELALGSLDPPLSWDEVGGFAPVACGLEAISP